MDKRDNVLLAAASKSIVFFVRRILGAEPTKQQLAVLLAIDDGAKKIAIKSGHGCFAKGHKVLMYDGSIKNVEDIEVGDLVMGDDGTMRIVLELKRGQEEMYEFTFSSGDKHIYNASHKLVLYTGRTDCEPVLVTVSDWLMWPKSEKDAHFVLKRAPSGDALLSIKSVKPLGVGDYYGFTLNGNHRFLSGDFIVTRNTGKTSMLAWIVLYAVLFREDCKVPMTAPAAPQLTEILIPEIRKWHARLPKQLRDIIEVRKEKVINTQSKSFAVARTARRDNPDALQGFHATHLFFLIDEASGVPREIYEVAEGALTSDNSFAIMTGNPTRNEGYFYDAFHKNAWQWKTFTFNAEKSENVSQKAIEEYRRKYGRDSDVYRVRVLGEFPKEAGDSVFVLADIEDAINRPKGEYNKKGPEIWGLDIGGNSTDSDASVLVKRKGYHFYEIKKFHGLDLEELAERLQMEYAAARRKPKAIFVDMTGMGHSFPSMAHRRGLDMVYGVNFGRIKHEMYYDNRTKLYYTLKEILPYAKLPNDDEMLGDLMAQSFEILPDGKIKLLDKKTHVIPKLGRSPDVSDAMVLTCESEFYIIPEEETKEAESLGEERLQTTIGGATW